MTQPATQRLADGRYELQGPPPPAQAPAQDVGRRAVETSWHLRLGGYRQAGSWQLPKGLLGAATVLAVAAWSWNRWHSGYNTAVAALTASSFTIALEIALTLVSPQAARSLFGVRGGVWRFYGFAVAMSLAACVLIYFLVA